MEFFDSLLFMFNEMSPYILLGFLIAGMMHAFVPRRTMGCHLSGTGFKAAVKASLIGIPLPLCSCGVLPVAVSMRRSGASRASTTSFLIATPQTGVDSIAATWSMLGPAFAVMRPVAALVTALCGGMAVGRGEKEAACAGETDCLTDNEAPQGFARKMKAALRYGYIDLVGSIGGWLMAGLVIAALITIYVPADFFAALGASPLLSMLAVLVIAVPMYVCATGSIPIAMSLVMKGLSPGTALVLLMAGPAVNFASFTLIGREMGRWAACVYVLSIVLGSLAFGLMIDYLLPASWFVLPSASFASHGCHHHLELFPTLCSIVLAALLLDTFVASRFHRNHKSFSDMSRTFVVKGMNCPHCQASVARAIEAVDGVTAVDVNLSSGEATVEGDFADEAIERAVRAAGFSL